MHDTPDVMTLDEAAAYVRVSTTTLYRLAQAEKIPVRKVGRQWRFSRAALDQWLAAGGTSDNEASG